jgi:hypothetical protein
MPNPPDGALSSQPLTDVLSKRQFLVIVQEPRALSTGATAASAPAFRAAGHRLFCVMIVHEPSLHPIAIADLRPTQITVGMHEVGQKRERWRKLSQEKGDIYLGRHMIPSVLGPKGRHYIVDNHHLARAMWDEGVKEVLVTVQADLSALPKLSFWRYLDNRALCHPYNAEGHRVYFDQIPTSVSKLIDDPYRSLAGSLRHLGGYAKDMTPFSEFLWADFLRSRIKQRAVEKDFARSLNKALIMAKSDDASYLPGWCGADPIS